MIQDKDEVPPDLEDLENKPPNFIPETPAVAKVYMVSC